MRMFGARPAQVPPAVDQITSAPIGEQALKFFVQLYEVERQVHQLGAGERRRIRQERSGAVADALHPWLTQQRQTVPEGSATIKAID